MINRWLRTTRLVLVSLFAAALVGCGGSGGGTGSGGFLGGSGDTWAIELTLTDADGNAVNLLESGATATLTATLTSSGSGDRVSGQVVNLTGTGVEISPASGSVTTDSEGAAVFSITAGPDGGAATLTATAEAPGGTSEATLNFNIEAIPPSLPTLVISLTDEAGGPITGVDPLTPGYVSVILSDADGAPIENGIVSLETTIGRIQPESGTALTNAGGVAIFRVLQDGEDGAGTLTASYSVEDEVYSTSLNFAVTSALPFKLTPIFKDQAGQNITTASTAQTIELQVSIVDIRTEQPQAFQIVSADVDGLGTLIPDSGSALTDETGIATFNIAVGDSVGPYTVTVSSVLAGGLVSETITLNVVQAERKLGYFDDGVFKPGVIKIEPTEQLSPTGTAALTIAVVDENNERTSTPETITLTSDCLYSDLASLEPGSPITFTSQVTIAYVAAGCSGGDELTATLTSTGASASGTIDIAPLEAESIAFLEASPSIIGLRETGNVSGLPEKSTIRFEVTDFDGNPIRNVRVNFSLSSYVGGAALYCEDEEICDYNSEENAGLSRSRLATDRTDLDGVAVAELLSGYVATPVRVSAYIDINENNERESNEPQTTTTQLVITTGLPDQDSISISASTLNVEGAFDTDGVTSDITVRLADKYNNPVPDNTQAVFTTELGSIVGSCVTLNGACSVKWTSQDPRLPAYADPITIRGTRWISGDAWNYKCPRHNEDSGPCPFDLADPAINPPGYARGGRSTILVTAIGEESFADTNGNGLYDKGEFWTNLPEAFRDDNEDGVHTPSQRKDCDDPVLGDELCQAGFDEDFVDFNTNGVYDLNNEPEAEDDSSLPDGLYNGVLCPDSLDLEGVCSRDLVNVRDSLVLVMSFSDASAFELLVIEDDERNEPNDRDPLDGEESYTLYVADIFNNPPPAGTTISYEGSGRCDVLTPAPTVGDSNRAGALGVAFAVSTADFEDKPADPDQVSIILTLPNGSKTVATYGCKVEEPDSEGPCDPLVDPLSCPST